MFTILIIILSVNLKNKYNDYKSKREAYYYFFTYNVLFSISGILESFIFLINNHEINNILFKPYYMIIISASYFAFIFGLSFLEKGGSIFKRKISYVLLIIQVFFIILLFFTRVGNPPINLDQTDLISSIFTYSFIIESIFATCFVSYKYLRYAYLYRKKGKSFNQSLLIGITVLLSGVFSNILYIYELYFLSTLIFYIGLIGVYVAFINNRELNILLEDIFHEILDYQKELVVKQEKFNVLNKSIPLVEQNLVEYDEIKNKNTILREILNHKLYSNEIILIFTPIGKSQHILSGIEPKINNNFIKVFEYSVNIDTLQVFRENGIEINRTSIDLSLLYEIICKGTEVGLERNKRVTLIFDSLTELLNWYDFSKTYKFIKRIADKLKEDPTRFTTYFLINLKSHDEKTKNAIHVIFDNVLIFGNSK